MLLPVMSSWRELGLDIDDLEPIAKTYTIREGSEIGAGGMTKVMETRLSHDTYKEWWNTLSKSQREITFGKVRVDLLDKHLIDYDNMVDRKNGRVRTLKELGFDLRGNKL